MAKGTGLRVTPTPPQGNRGLTYLWVQLAAIVAAGLLSRTVHTGNLLFDKYLGDALYAAMVYVLLRLTGRLKGVWLLAAAVMTAIELFQLTGIPAALFRTGNPVLRAIARLMGVEFSGWDLLAYAVGIAVLECLELRSPLGASQRRQVE